MDSPSNWAVFVLAIAILMRAASVILSIYKSPKEVTSDLAQEMRKAAVDMKEQVREVKSDVEDIRDEHHALAREVSEITGSMRELKTSMDDLRDQIKALSNVVGVFNAASRSNRR